MAELFSQTVSAIQSAIKDNDFFSGGFVLLLIGGTAALLRQLPSRIWNWLLRRFTVTMEVAGTDDVFGWLQVWLAAQGYTSRARRWIVTSKNNRLNGVGEIDQPDGAVDESPRESLDDIILIPAPGQHIFKYRGRWIWLVYSREPVKTDSNILLGYHETMLLRVLGHDQSVIRELIREAHDLAVPSDPSMIDIRVVIWGSWRRIGSKQARPLSSLIFDNNIGEELLNDLRQFLNSREWYYSLGIPYHRGYLLSGPPGSGKSSLVVALARELRMDLCVVPLDPNMSDERFRNIILEAPKDSILLLEDIDKVPLCEMAEVDTHGEGRLTLSAVLNVIDGILPRDGQIIFMTANDVERLHPALLRPGRADIHVRLENATATQAARMFKRFYGSQYSEEAERFGRLIEPMNLSMAAIQEHLLRHKDDMEAALDIDLITLQYKQPSSSIVSLMP